VVTIIGIDYRITVNTFCTLPWRQDLLTSTTISHLHIFWEPLSTPRRIKADPTCQISPPLHNQDRPNNHHSPKSSNHLSATLPRASPLKHEPRPPRNVCLYWSVDQILITSGYKLQVRRSLVITGESRGLSHVAVIVGTRPLHTRSQSEWQVNLDPCVFVNHKFVDIRLHEIEDIPHVWAKVLYLERWVGRLTSHLFDTLNKRFTFIPYFGFCK